MGRRERNRVRTREAMIAVAYRLFREQGYDETTVEEIADGADVSPRTFYRYFTSKDNILADHGIAITSEVLDRASPCSSVDELLDHFAVVMEEAAADDQFRTFARLLRENPRLADRGPVWRQAWEDHLAVGLGAGAGRGESDLECRLRSALTLRLMALAIDRWLYEQPDARLVDLVREMAVMGRDHFTEER